MSLIERIINKKSQYTIVNGVVATNLVISIPVCLELIDALKDRVLVSPKDIDGSNLLGLRVTVLKVNKELLEVG
jgi:hypothetical protein